MDKRKAEFLKNELLFIYVNNRKKSNTKRCNAAWILVLNWILYFVNRTKIFSGISNDKSRKIVFEKAYSNLPHSQRAMMFGRA